MGFARDLKSLFPEINTMAANAAGAALDDLAEKAKDPTERMILGLLGSALEKHGPAGLAMAENAVIDLLEGKPVNLDFADLLTASDALAVLQNVEAGKKSEARDFASAAAQQMGMVLGVMIRGAIIAS